MSLIDKKFWMGLMAVGLAFTAGAAPFNRDMKFKQPDGQQITVHGWGDEFYAEFTHFGYPVVYNETTHAYDYAVLNADATRLVSSGYRAGTVNPATIAGLDPNARITKEARRALALPRIQKWRTATNIDQRWKKLKSRHLTTPTGAITLKADTKYQETTGVKVGVTLLVDFPDEPASIPVSDIEEWLNGDNYTGYGNNGSVRGYYLDVSNGNLDYSNVVIGYVRLPQTKGFYDNPDATDPGAQATRMVQDAINVLKRQDNYTTEILPLLETATKDGNAILAFNMLYAGECSSTWARGLWPHASSFSGVSFGDGLEVRRYQTSDIGDDLAIGTFCHENGHMLCGYDDLYDYDYDSEGGAGYFCLMGGGSYGGGGKNPVEICGFLKYISGWTTSTELDSSSYITNAVATVDHTSELYNHVYVFINPAVSNEYYIVENRQQWGRDADLKASGLAIWHIDEDGNRDDQRYEYNTEHQNFECTLMQADGKWDLNNNVNDGDKNDLYYEGNSAPGYINEFSESSNPSSQWWDGSYSGFNIIDIGPCATNMTFKIVPSAPKFTNSRNLLTGRIGSYYKQRLYAVKGNKPYEWSIEEDYELPPGLGLDSETGIISGIPTEVGTYTFVARVSCNEGAAFSLRTFVIKVVDKYSIPYSDKFTSPDFKNGWGWYQDDEGDVQWYFANGNASDADANYPLRSYSSPSNAVLKSAKASLSGASQMLISPMFDFGENPRSAQLKFWLYKRYRGALSNTDALNVYYKTAWDEEWQLLQSYTNTVNKWQQKTINLPDLSRTYYVAFEGIVNGGYGIHIDDVWVGDGIPKVDFENDDVLPDAAINTEYTIDLIPSGGSEPYTYTLLGELPDWLEFDEEAGVLTGTPTELGTWEFTVAITDGFEETTQRTFTLTVDNPRTNLYVEDFEKMKVPPDGWSQVYVISNVSWMVQALFDHSWQEYNNWVYTPSGESHAVLWWNDTEHGDGGPYSDHITQLITPELNLGFSPSVPRLNFMLNMQPTFNNNLDQLRVYYRGSPSEEWNLLAEYTEAVTNWTEIVLDLPNPTMHYQICFEGNAKYGNGIHIDNIRISDTSAAPMLRTSADLDDGYVGLPYEMELTTIGGAEPYTWTLADDSELPDGLTLDPVTGIISGTPTKEAAGTTVISVVITGSDGNESINEVSITINQGVALPFSESFDDGELPDGWSAETLFGTNNWEFLNGSKIRPSRGIACPDQAYSPDYNACFAYPQDDKYYSARLTLPMIEFGSGVTNAAISFQLCNKGYDISGKVYRDELKVKYRTSLEEEWITLATYPSTFAVEDWTKFVVELPNPCATYFICFEATQHAGWGVCVDDVEITSEGYISNYDIWVEENFPDGYPGDTVDSDGDGIPNIWEYIWDTDPTDPDDEMDLGLALHIVIVDDVAVAYYPEPSEEALEDGFKVVLEGCTDLMDPQWTTDLVQDTDKEPDVDEVWDKIFMESKKNIFDQPKLFLRLRLIYP